MSNKSTHKVYVLDTTVLIDNPHLPYELADGDVVIPIGVLKELDGLKNSDVVHVARSAREVSRLLDNLGSRGNLEAGVRLSTGNMVRLYPFFEIVNLLSSYGDNLVLGAALHLKSSSDAEVIVVTTDVNMRIAARSLGSNVRFGAGKVIGDSMTSGSVHSGDLVVMGKRSRWGLFFSVVVVLLLIGMSFVGLHEYAIMIGVFLGYCRFVVWPLAKKRMNRGCYQCGRTPPDGVFCSDPEWYKLSNPASPFFGGKK